MTEVTALFWDAGGVFLSNGWDKKQRQRAAEQFGLDWNEFDGRHQLVVGDFEKGRIGIDRYLQETVWHRERPFRPQDFKDFMFAQSEPKPESLDIIASLARLNKHLMCTINNESLELNLHRIERFALHKYFSLFFSSSFVGLTKPDQEIYRLALRVTHRKPEETIFVDDRAENAEAARKCGMHAIHFQSPDQLLAALRDHGVI